MNLTTVLLVFVVIFPAELPDKTALASLILSTRYRASLVFVGVAAAFVCHVALAVAAGSVLRLLPHRLLSGIVSALFLMGAVLLLRGRHQTEEGEEKLEEPSLTPIRVVGTSFLVVLAAEFGDLTQIVTANLAAKYQDPLAVGIGAVLALWAVAGIAILGGQTLLAKVPLVIVTRVAATIMVGLAAVSFVKVF